MPEDPLSPRVLCKYTTISDCPKIKFDLNVTLMYSLVGELIELFNLKYNYCNVDPWFLQRSNLIYRQSEISACPQRTMGEDGSLSVLKGGLVCLRRFKNNSI